MPPATSILQEGFIVIRRGSIPLIDAAAAFLIFSALQLAIMNLSSPDPYQRIESLIEEESLRSDAYRIIFSRPFDQIFPPDGDSVCIEGIRISVDLPSCGPYIPYLLSFDGGAKIYYITRAG